MIEQSSISEDFTFPKLAYDSSPPYLGFPTFTASSLWCVPSTLPNCSHVTSDQDRDVGEETQELKRLLSAEDGRREDTLPRDMDFYCNGDLDDCDVSSVDDEEKMDMLWEDFNDELGRRPSWCRKEAEKRNGSLKDWAIDVEMGADSSQMAQVDRDKALKVSKNAYLLHHRRPSLLVILKILKKLFLLHNSHSPKRS